MPQFAYIARRRSGEKVEGSLEAGDRRAAVARLERMGYVPVRLTAGAAAKARPAPASGAETTPRKSQWARKRPAGPRPGRAGGSGKPAARGAGASRAPMMRGLFGARAPRLKMREILLFTRELSDLLASGMTLGRALNTLSSRQTTREQDAIMVGLRDDIVQGASLSEALAQYPETFSSLYVSMVRAGEASGTLPDVLERLCTHYQRVQEAREKVLMAMVYPAIILTVGAGTLVFSVIFVIPRFTAIFEELDGELPAATQLLANMSQALIDYWWAFLLVVAGGVYLFRRLVRTEAGLRWWHRAQLRMPLVKSIISANAFGHFARTLGALLSNGVPVLTAMSIVEKTVENRVISDEIAAARARVSDGSTISGPLAEGRVFPRLLTDMLAVGEESGDMSGALVHIANRYERELDRTVKIFTSVLEPIMILVMAVLVGFVAISMLTAVFDLTSGLNP